MNLLFDSTLAHVFLGLGLASLCGFRAFLPLLVLALFVRFNVLGAPQIDGTWASFLTATWCLVALGVLTLLEVALDKASQPGLAVDFIFTPLRVIAGAFAFALAMAAGGIGPVIIGVVAGAAVAFVGSTARGALRPGAEGTAGAQNRPFLSLFEDFAVAIGAIAVLAFPFLGILLLLFVLFLVYRVRVRRRRKYKGLRILKD